MSGNSKKLLVLLQILFYELMICIAHTNEETPTIHSILLKNETIIPEEHKNLPVVGKCCMVGEGLVRSEANPAICSALNSSNAENFSPIFHSFNNSGFNKRGRKRSSFVAIIGNPCKYKRYVLDPDIRLADKHYLLANGSVYIPYPEETMLQPGMNYCMDIIPGSGLKTFGCFSEDPIIMSADSRITIYACVLLISVPFLILTIVAYSITPKLQDVYGKALCRYCGCLALAFTTLAVTQLSISHISPQVCTSTAFVIQFSFIACFFWLNAMCIEMWLLVRSYVDRETYKRMKPKTLFFWYSLWCWGPLVILILVSMIMDFSPMIPASYAKYNSDQEGCSLRSDGKSMQYFYVPIGLLLFGNMILFILTFIKLNKYQKDLDLRRLARNQESDRIDRKFFRRLTRATFACMFIFFLMGLNWTMELMSWFIYRNSFDWSSFDFLNALQGVLVFGLFVLRRPPRDYVWQRIQQLRGIEMILDPEDENTELYLLPIIVNGDSMPRQTIIS